MDVTVTPMEIQSSDCQKISQVLARVGEKWSILIIMMLSGGPRRFTELKRSINGISQRMLTLCLRGLNATASSTVTSSRSCHLTSNTA